MWYGKGTTWRKKEYMRKNENRYRPMKQHTIWPILVEQSNEELTDTENVNIQYCIKEIINHLKMLIFMYNF